MLNIWTIKWQTLTFSQVLSERININISNFQKISKVTLRMALTLPRVVK